VDLSPNTFAEMVKAGKMPKPKQLTGRRFAWDVRALDLAVDHLPTVGASVGDESWSDIDAT
jgi:predicted DNA-binding transcriptional regulator AlpA